MSAPLNMPPVCAPNNASYGHSGNPHFFGDGNLSFSISKLFPDGKNLGVGKFGHPVSFAFICFPQNHNGVMHVFGVSYPFQIAKCAVAFGAVFVIALRPLWIQPNKSFKNQPVKQFFDKLAVFCKTHIFVAIEIKRRISNTNSVARTRSFLSKPSKIADGIQTLVTNYWTPLFNFDKTLGRHFGPFVQGLICLGTSSGYTPLLVLLLLPEFLSNGNSFCNV